MKVIRARNVHQALPEALYQLESVGVVRSSRNGDVYMFPEPVTTVYEKPAERVVFWAERDANPFFHLMEALWMLGGRNDVGYVAQYVSRMREFSDDGKTFHGAYGFRWREHFGVDQLTSIIAALKANPDDRRQVLSMWDASVDLGRVGKDFPCNLQAIFQVAHDGRLDMTVTNRSNDMIWGAYGANAVHFSYLHEYVARAIEREQGVYRQVSANFHTYQAVYGQIKGLSKFAANPNVPKDAHWHDLDPYIGGVADPYPLMQLPVEEWDKELEMFLSEPLSIGFRDPFFRRVAVPMYKAHAAYKKTDDENRFFRARNELSQVAALDWYQAAMEWIGRREEAVQRRLARAQDDGVEY